MTSARKLKRRTSRRIGAQILYSIGIDDMDGSVTLTVFEHRNTATLRLSAQQAQGLTVQLLAAPVTCRLNQSPK